MDFSADWIIAEIGSVHDGSLGNASKLIEAAADAGANCVKFQTHIAEAESLADAPAPAYFTSESRLDYFRRTSFAAEGWKYLSTVAQKCGVTFLSSPFSMEAVDLLEEVGVEAYKIPSGEVTNLPLLSKVARTGKPVLLSTGMSSWAEMGVAVEVLQVGGPLCVMQCTSSYPTPATLVGLNNLAEIARRFPNVTLGFSDHTMGAAAGIAAATLGATVIEKHFTFSRLMYGSDAKHSMEPAEFREFAGALRDVWLMRRSPVDKDHLAAGELLEMKRIFQKSVVAARDLPGGTILTPEDLAYKKPGDGISAADYQAIVGRALRSAVAANHKFSSEDFE